MPYGRDPFEIKPVAALCPTTCAEVIRLHRRTTFRLVSGLCGDSLFRHEYDGVIDKARITKVYRNGCQHILTGRKRIDRR